MYDCLDLYQDNSHSRYLCIERREENTKQSFVVSMILKGGIENSVLFQ